MKTTCEVFLALVLSVILVASPSYQTVNAEPSTGGWTKTYGGAYYALLQTNDGGYALAGSAGTGGGDFWLVKTDASGNTQLNRVYGGTYGEYAHDLVQTNDGGYALAGVTASFGAGRADAYLVKTDASGNTQWSKAYGRTAVDYAYALVQTGDGGYALAGYTDSFGSGLEDAWLVKTDANGNTQWNQTYGGIAADYAYALVQTGDGGYALAGFTKSFGGGLADFWLVKTDASGNMQWNKAYGGTSGDEAHALVQTSDGGYALAGYGFANLVKTDASGVVPEFPSHMILVALFVVTSLAVILTKRKFRGSPRKPY